MRVDMPINPDKAGTATALLCGIHCVLTPVVMAAVPSFEMPEAWEYAFFAASFLMAAWSAASTYRHDQSRWPVLAMLGGLMVLICPHLLGLPESTHPITAVIGASILIATHVRNMKVHAGCH
jgi:drug/metabolite transporter (DMT)-like permease